MLYPDGYQTNMISLAQMKDRHGPKMHPEFFRRFFAYIEAQDGLLGVGGGWRDTQPDKPGFAPDGRSFHQYQEFASGIVAYCAVDLVARNGIGRHRAPTWAEGATAPEWGLHTFIDNEPWHIQPVEIRGWQGWVKAGRLDPDPAFQLPGQGDTMPGEYVKVDPDDTAMLCRFGRFVWWLQTASDVHAVAALCVNTPDTATILTEADRADATFLGHQPHYHKASKAGSVRCNGAMFGRWS